MVVKQYKCQNLCHISVFRVYDYESCVKQQIRNKIIMTMMISRFDEHIKSYLRQMGYPYRALT